MKKALFILPLILFLVFLVVIPAGAAPDHEDPTPTETPTPTSTPTVTNTPTPSSTPTPTNTPTPMGPAGPVEMLDSTIPVDAGVAAAVEVLLEAENPCANTSFYAITDTSMQGSHFLISIVGLDVASVEDSWNIEDDSTCVASMRVIEDPEDVFTAQWDTPTPPESGGSGGIIFPWVPGYKAKYGSAAVHGGGGQIIGGVGIDWFGGTQYGGNSMPNMVLASAAGVIDFICRDGFQVTVRINSGSTSIAYLHLEDNPTLVKDRTIQQGQQLGKLKMGTFDEPCGYAQQAETSWHVHWVIVPSNSQYLAGGWVLSTADENWHRGADTVKPLDWMMNDGATGTIVLPPGEGNPNPQNPYIYDPSTGTLILQGGHIWDMPIMGLNDFANSIISKLPEAGGEEMGGAADIFTKMTLIIHEGLKWVNILVLLLNIQYLVTVISVVIASEIIYWVISALRLIYKLFPAAG